MRIGTVFILVTDIFLVLRKCLTHCCCSVAQSWPTFCDPMDYSMPGLPVPHHLLKFAQVHVYCISNAFQPSHPLVPSSPPAVNLSQHQGFSSELGVPVGWPKYWSFSFSISPSNEYSELISLTHSRGSINISKWKQKNVTKVETFIPHIWE